MARARVVLKACSGCHFISEGDVCPRCGGSTTKDWNGMVCVSDFEKSEIAKKMQITANGNYALKVRD